MSSPGPLLTLLEAPPDDPERVTQALMQSSTLSARVLSVTNSAAIGVVGEISDIRRAVLHMGAGRARSIAMAFGLHMLSKDSGIDLEVAHRIWINSLEKAHLAKLVAEAVEPREADRAYTLGLIQDIGLTALVAIDPQFYEQVSNNHRHQNPLSIREQEHFGIDHAQAANHLLQSWNASPLICEEVLNHHQPMLSQNDYSGSNLGNLIAGMLPHDCETMTPDRMEWLAATHSQFLDSSFDSPEQMIKQAVKQSREVHGAAPSIRIDEATRLRMLGELELDTAGMVHQLCELEAQLTRKHEQLHALQFEAMTDPLTQVLNRRGFNRLGERRIHTAAERCLPICAVMIDLDGFKAINDTLGHDAGDIMLMEVAKQIRGNIDSSDLFGRLGGDEFAILQLNVDEENRKKDHRTCRRGMQRQNRAPGPKQTGYTPPEYRGRDLQQSGQANADERPDRRRGRGYVHQQTCRQRASDLHPIPVYVQGFITRYFPEPVDGCVCYDDMNQPTPPPIRATPAGREK